MSMTCTILTAEALSRDLESMTSLFRRLTKPGSDFNRKLHRWMTLTPAVPEDGSIAVVREDDEIIGWARTEVWQPDAHWATLEAFVDPAHRGRGVAAFAAAGLVACCGLEDGQPVAVFAPAMLMLARRVDLHPVLFLRDHDGKWARQ